jgi:hypothetical protein
MALHGETYIKDGVIESGDVPLSGEGLRVGQELRPH